MPRGYSSHWYTSENPFFIITYMLAAIVGVCVAYFHGYDVFRGMIPLKSLLGMVLLSAIAVIIIALNAMIVQAWYDLMNRSIKGGRDRGLAYLKTFILCIIIGFFLMINDLPGAIPLIMIAMLAATLFMADTPTCKQCHTWLLGKDQRDYCGDKCRDKHAIDKAKNQLWERHQAKLKNECRIR